MEQNIAEIKALADSGDPWAMIRYADYLQKEDSTLNGNQAAYYYKNASTQHNYIAMNRYAIMLRYGKGIKKDLEKAYSYFKMAVNEGDQNSMPSCANMCSTGQGCPKDHEKAHFLYKLYLEKVEYIELDSKKMSNGDKVPDEYFDILQEYKKKTLEKRPNVLNSLGCIYYEGRGVEADNYEAMYFFKDAADRGDTNGMYNYADMIIKKEGAKREMSEAVFYLKMAAEKGDCSAMCYYGDLLRIGTKIKENENEAFRYYKMAADADDADGQYNLAWCYLFGDGVKSDNNEAIRYIKLAMDQKNYKAMGLYGFCLENGKGVKVDLKEAQRYYQKAVDGGVDKYKKDLDRLKSRCCNIF